MIVVPRWASGLPLLWPSWRCIPWLEWLATTAFWSPVSHLVTFGAVGITWRAFCSASWVLLCVVGAVLRGCRWCVTIAVVAGVGHSPLVLADNIHRFGAVGDLFPGMLDDKWLTSMSASSLEGVLKWLCHKFPKELSLMAVCTDNTAMQFMLMMLIIDHLAGSQSASWCMWQDLGGPLLAWPQYLRVLQDTHGCWCAVSFPVWFSWGRQKLLPWLLSVPLHCW